MEADFEAPSSSAEQASRIKPKRPPTVTPKRFTRFFTPRQSVVETRKSKYASKAARTLREITGNGINKKQPSPRKHIPKANSLDLDAQNLLTPSRKRQKLTPLLESSPIQLLSTPSKHAGGNFHHIEILDDDGLLLTEEEDEAVDEVCDDFFRHPKPIRRLPGAHASHRLLERSFGGLSTLGRGKLHDSCADWRYSTNNFYSYSSDIHTFDPNSLPFCTTACNNNSLVAFGDEKGGVTLVDSANSEAVDFAKAHVSFRPHTNAVMDINFSSDDFLMATASGDQTARVIDMRTQQTRFIMAGHVSSVKQVRFQPGNDNVLATSSRDGSVQIWDMRCRGTAVPAQELHIAEDEPRSDGRKVVYADTCISIKDAHCSIPNTSTRRSADIFSVRNAPAPSKHDISITAISFLPQGREHLLLSASAANASIKVWDIRSRYSSRKGPAVPISATAEPASHLRHRRSGLTSMCLSTDASRLFSLCRDSRVYAFSIPHLILGHAPEFSQQSRAFVPAVAKQGLAPLYAIEHPALDVSSFYIKAALRPARGANTEVLAVGSRGAAPVLFPTDETAWAKIEDEEDGLPSRAADLPVYSSGAPLVRGHGKEVTALAWSFDGELVSVSDDFTARCWREDAGRAERLRECGEGEGERWRCGWAEEGV